MNPMPDARLERLVPPAPLHLPHHLAAIRSIQTLIPGMLAAE